MAGGISRRWRGLFGYYRMGPATVVLCYGPRVNRKLVANGSPSSALIQAGTAHELDLPKGEEERRWPYMKTFIVTRSLEANLGFTIILRSCHHHVVVILVRAIRLFVKNILKKL